MIGPKDYEIAEIGLDNIFESILPGSETEPASPSTSTNEDTDESTEVIIDDPLGW